MPSGESSCGCSSRRRSSNNLFSQAPFPSYYRCFRLNLAFSLRLAASEPLLSKQRNHNRYRCVPEWRLKNEDNAELTGSAWLAGFILFHPFMQLGCSYFGHLNLNGTGKRSGWLENQNRQVPRLKGFATATTCFQLIYPGTFARRRNSKYLFGRSRETTCSIKCWRLSFLLRSLIPARISACQTIEMEGLPG